MASKGKGIADGKNSSGKRKRQDDDNGGKSTKNRSVLQFFEDAAVEDGDGDSDSLSDDFFDDDFLADFNVDPKVKSEPGRFDQVPFWPKEEELSGDELEKMLEERYRRGSGYVRYAEDDYESKRSVDKSEFMPSVEPTIWKVKCKVGREKNTVFCLIQKFVDLKVLGTKLQIISAFAVEHIKGFVFVEAEKQSDVAAACNQLADVYFSLVTPVPSNEVGQLLVVKKRYHEVKEGTWARVKNGIYRGDLAQVVAVNNERKKATVKLVPRIDLQALTVKYGGGANLKRTKGTVPAARLISSSDLEEFRPLIQYRRDRDTGKMFEFLDSLMLKDGFLYKKVSIDSLSFWGVNPSEDELQKFTISSNDESDNVEWLSQLYGEPKKKPIVNYEKGGGKGGGKGEGSSGSLEQSSFEVHDLVHFGKRDFGMVVGMEKDENYKVLKDCLEGSVTLTLGQKDLKYVPQEKKFTALDHRMKTISINDTVRILEGPVKGRQGIVKQVYRGVIFLYDENDLDNAYFCTKSQMSEKVKHSACHGKDEGGPSSFEDVPSSPKSPLSPKKPWQRGNNSDVDQTEKDGMFSVGQSLRIRTGPLKGYLCRVLAIRYSDVTVKLDSKHKVLTVKRDHLSEVRGKSSLIRDDPETSSPFKPFDLLGTEGTTNDWLQPASGSADGDGWNVGGMSSERSAWPAFPSSGASIQAGTAATDLPSSVEDTAWLSKVAAGNEKAVDNSDQVGGWGTSSGGWEKAKAPVGDHEGSWNVGGCSSSQGKADNATNSWSSQIAEKSQPDPLDKGKCTEEQGGWNNIGSGSEPGTSGWGKPKTCTESVTWGEGTESSKQSIGNAGGVGWAEPKCSINPAEDSWGKAADGWGKNDTAAASSWGNSSIENDRVTSSWDKGKSWNDNKGDGSKGWNKSNEPDKDGGGWSLEKSSPQTGWKGVSSGSSGWGNSSQMSEEKAIDGWKKDAITTSGGWAPGGDVSQGNSWGKEYGGEGRESWSKPAGSGGRSGGRGFGGGSDQSGRGGGGRLGGGNCYKCGELGHMARECPSGGSSGGGGSCYKCGELGHMARECPSGGGGGGGGNCYKCGESGHMARECPSGGSSGGGGKCYKCGESGHMARECPSGGSGGGGGKCYKCGESGHMARECPSGGSGGGGGNCYKCGESGHMARECPSGGGGGGGKCYKCGEPGHMARECPSGGGGGGGGKCYKCGEPGHMARECPSGGGGVSYGSSWGGGGSDKSSGDGTEKKGWSMGGGGGSSWGGSGGRYGSSWGGGSSDKPSGDVAEEKGWSTAGGGGSSWGNSGGRSESSWGGGSSEKPSGDGAKEKGWSTAGAGGSSWGNGGGRSGSSWGGGSSDKPSGDGVKEKGSSWGGGSCDGAQEKGSSWGGGSSEKPSEDGAPEKGWSMAGGGGSSWGSGSNNKKGGWD